MVAYIKHQRLHFDVNAVCIGTSDDIWEYLEDNPGAFTFDLIFEIPKWYRPKGKKLKQIVYDKQGFIILRSKKLLKG